MRLLAVTLAAAAAITPKGLLHALVTTPWPASALPPHVTVHQAGAVSPSVQGLRFHAVGEIAFVFKGPDPVDEVLFEVFPSKADALGDLTHPRLQPGDKLRGAVPGIPHSAIITGTVVESGRTVGVTLVGAVRNNVIVQAIASSTTTKTEGHTAEAMALLKAALAHLAQLTAGVTS
jgi:hypothetical protein